MKKIITLFTALIITTFGAFAQQNPTYAKAEYQLAEQAFSKSEYETVLEHLKKSVEFAGKENQLTLYLKILTYNELSALHTLYIDSLKTNLDSFFNHSEVKKLGTTRYNEIVSIRDSFNGTEAVRKEKQANFYQVKSLCNNGLYIGIDKATLEKNLGTKKVKNIINQRYPIVSMEFFEYDLDKDAVSGFELSVDALYAQDIPDMTCVSSDGILKKSKLTFSAALLKQQNIIVGHVYLASPFQQQFDMKECLISDFGTPLTTSSIEGNEFLIWKFGNNYIFYAPMEGSHVVLLYNSELLH